MKKNDLIDLKNYIGKNRDYSLILNKDRHQIVCSHFSNPSFDEPYTLFIEDIKIITNIFSYEE